MADERFGHAQVHANVIHANTSTTINITANQETGAALRELVRPSASALTGIPLLQVENGKTESTTSATLRHESAPQPPLAKDENLFDRFCNLWGPYYNDSYTDQNVSGTDIRIPSDKLCSNIYCEFKPGEGFEQQDHQTAKNEPSTELRGATGIAPASADVGAEANRGPEDEEVEGASNAAAATSPIPEDAESESESEASDSEVRNDSDYETDDESKKEDTGIKLETYDRFEEMLKKEFDNKHNRVVITGPGGIGKTTMSKMFCLKWANKEHFQHMKAVVRIELKHEISDDNLFTALCEQYKKLLTEEFTQEELKDLEPVLKKNQERFVFLYDGFDESSPKARLMTQDLFHPECQDYRKTPMLLFTRSEALEELPLTAHFSIRPLETEDYEDFIQTKYPFSHSEEAPAEAKREKLVTKCRASPTLQSFVAIPFFLLMLCMLFDDNELEGQLEEGIDLFLALLGMSIKNAMLKHYESKSETNKVKEVKRMNNSKLLNVYGSFISALGYALFKTNKDAVSGYEDIPKEELEEHLAAYFKSIGDTDDIVIKDKTTAILRLAFFDTNVKEGKTRTTTVIRFHHRHIQDVVLSFFLAHITTTLPGGEKAREKMRDSETTIIRCVLAILMKMNVPAEQLKLSLFNLYDHMFRTYRSIDKWRQMQMLVDLICSFLQFHNKCPLLEVVNHLVEKLQILDPKFKLLKNRSFFYNAGRFFVKETGLQQSDFPCLEMLLAHINDSRQCKTCVVPQCFQSTVTEIPSTSSFLSQWPQKQTLSLPPLIYNAENKIKFTFPQDSESHVKLNAISISVNLPQSFDDGDDEGLPDVTSLPSPIPVSVASCLPIDPTLENPENWVVAQSHVAFPFENCIWVWGGVGKNGSNLPGNVFWILNPATLSWTQVKTKGEIPEGRSLACGAIIGHKFYLFGGYGEKDGILFVCNLKTLTWRRTEPKGKTPVGRFRATAWTHGGKFYVFGGRNTSGKPSGKFLQGGDWKDNATNQLSVYSTKTNKWKDITSRGPTPELRHGMGQARIRDTVYIVGGGRIGLSFLNDVWAFDLRTKTWSEVEVEGPNPERRWDHSISAVTRRHLVSVGGYGYRGSARDDVWSFDVEGKSWRREEGLTEGKGLRYHTATTVGEETVILGGYLSGQGENGLSTKMFIFRMSPK